MENKHVDNATFDLTHGIISAVDIVDHVVSNLYGQFVCVSFAIPNDFHQYTWQIGPNLWRLPPTWDDRHSVGSVLQTVPCHGLMDWSEDSC